MHSFSVLPCLVGKKNTTCITAIIYCDLSISVLCSNIFSHAATGQCMRHKKETCLFEKVFVWKN